MNTLKTGLISAVLAILAASCNAPEQAAPAEVATPESKAAPSSEAAPRPLPALAAHARWIIPGSNIQFAAEANLPDTSEKWARVAAAARRTAEGAQHLVEASDQPADPRWRDFARATAAHAEKAALGAESENPDDLMMADGDMLDSCNGCHAAFRQP